jgi:hypothetical protein
MKSFFYDSYAGKEVSAAQPIEMTLDECLRTLNRFRKEGSFLGVLLDGNRVFQIRREHDGLFWVEILDRQQRLADGCVSNLPVAEFALTAAMEGRPIKEALSEYRLNWERNAV